MGRRGPGYTLQVYSLKLIIYLNSAYPPSWYSQSKCADNMVLDGRYMVPDGLYMVFNSYTVFEMDSESWR